MRVSTTAMMAASALAIGLGMDAAQSFAPGGLPGGKIASPDAVIQQTQQKEQGVGPGMGGAGQGGVGQGGAGQGGGGPSVQGGGSKMPGGGGGGGLRQGGSQFSPGEKGLRGEHGFKGERGVRGEHGFRGERGLRGERGIREGREFRRGHGGAYLGPSYGYLPSSCGWLRRRALETDSPYWWRRYRACRGG